MSNEIRHGSSQHNVPITVLSEGVRVDATDGNGNPVLPSVLDVISESGSSLGAAPLFGLASAPLVTQDTDAGGNPLAGAYRISFVGRGARGGVFVGGETYRVLWSAEVEGAAYEDEVFVTVALPRIELTSPL